MMTEKGKAEVQEISVFRPESSREVYSMVSMKIKDISFIFYLFGWERKRTGPHPVIQKLFLATCSGVTLDNA